MNMARRMTKAENTAIGYLIIFGVIGYGVVSFFEIVGYVIPTIILVSIMVLYIASKVIKNKRRLSFLRAKYKNDELAQKIFEGAVWQNQTADQLWDSLGEPEEIDKKVLKTKKKEVWKYMHQGGNRFGLRITLENDEVVGWDKKA